jgi:hypothetical protein
MDAVGRAPAYVSAHASSPDSNPHTARACARRRTPCPGDSDPSSFRLPCCSALPFRPWLMKARSRWLHRRAWSAADNTNAGPTRRSRCKRLSEASATHRSPRRRTMRRASQPASGRMHRAYRVLLPGADRTALSPPGRHWARHPPGQGHGSHQHRCRQKASAALAARRPELACASRSGSGQLRRCHRACATRMRNANAPNTQANNQSMARRTRGRALRPLTTRSAPRINSTPSG